MGFGFWSLALLRVMSSVYKCGFWPSVCQYRFRFNLFYLFMLSFFELFDDFRCSSLLTEVSSRLACFSPLVMVLATFIDITTFKLNEL